MTRIRTLVIAVAVALGPTGTNAADQTVEDTLRKQHPDGIPWVIQFSDTAGSGLGRLEVLITTEPAKSCLGEIGTAGVRVQFVRKDGLPQNLIVASYGIAKFTANSIKIDLTGGMCDAYVLLSGSIAPDGTSSGDLYTFGMNGGHDLGTYHAEIH